MAQKTFALNTDPHIATIVTGEGEIELKFVPEMTGAEFLDAYAGVLAAQERIAKHTKGDDQTISLESVRDSFDAISTFLRTMMVPESQKVFDRLQLPQRVLTQLMNWVNELYGQKPTGSSSGLPVDSSKAVGPPSKRTQPSKGRSR